MKTSQKGIDLIKEFEGLRLAAYKDAVGVWTIGYGHTKTAAKGMTISKVEAERLLAQVDLPVYESGVTRLVKVPLAQHQFDALVSFAYNLGVGNLRSSSLLRKLNQRDYLSAAEEFKRWNKAGGRVLAGLTRRRLAEELMFRGKYCEK